MGNDPKDKLDEKDLSRQVSVVDIGEMISTAISKTIEGMAPYMQSASQPTVKKESENLRASIIKEMQRDFDHTVNANKRFLEKFANTPRSEMVYVQIPRVYAKYIGSVLPVGVNGSVVAIPVDNNPYLVPKVVKDIVTRCLAYEDEKISFMEASGNSDITETTVDSFRV